MVCGIDLEIYQKILNSGKWAGTEDELAQIVKEHSNIPQGILPLREAIDWVHSLIYSTIKAMKFSHTHQMCGGPPEVAVISTDRNFRWVHHKKLHSATGRTTFGDS
jgi:hypothetical protein